MEIIAFSKDGINCISHPGPNIQYKLVPTPPKDEVKFSSCGIWDIMSL